MIDDDAFADFVRTHSTSLFGTAFVLTGDAGRAEELLQDTLVRLYPQWSRVRAAESELAYVRRSVVNGFVSSQRRSGGRNVSMADVPEASARRDGIEAIIDRGELGHLLGTLPERQRAALVLRYLYDRSDAEISAAIGCRQVTVRSLISRGLRTLRAVTTGPGDRARTISGGDRHGR